MANPLSNPVPEKLTRAGMFLAARLDDRGLPVISPFDLHHMAWRMYEHESHGPLYLRQPSLTREAYARHRQNLHDNAIISLDPDYGQRVYRVLSVPDLPAEDIACLADPTVHVSHLSAMQRWGLTNRRPEALMLTRPDRANARPLLDARMNAVLEPGEPSPVPLRYISHPEKLRKRRLHLYQSRNAGAAIPNRSDHVRLSTIGQTFLDMLQRPDLCGGMSHVLDVWQEHASGWLEEIVDAVDTTDSPLVKSRAGYILDERLGLTHPRLADWQALGQRGSSRVLDPEKPFASAYSETWMISLNA